MSELPSILIVDDEQSARETLEALLHADGYRLEFAASGQAAIDRLRGPPVDLVICDVMMPGIHGFEVCRRIKADEHWRLVPVILATALDGPDDMVRGIESGADEFLTKPMDRVVLRSRVRAMLRIRSQSASSSSGRRTWMTCCSVDAIRLPRRGVSPIGSARSSTCSSWGAPTKRSARC